MWSSQGVEGNVSRVVRPVTRTKPGQRTTGSGRVGGEWGRPVHRKNEKRSSVRATTEFSFKKETQK